MTRMHRHTSLLACLLASATCAAAGPKALPDVVLITVDTLRADHLGAYGFPLPVSPNIDRLAARGVVYERAIAASAATGPSHASIMTSLYPRHHSVGYGNGVTTLVANKTLAEVFAENGYATGAFVGNVILVMPTCRAASITVTTA